MDYKEMWEELNEKIKKSISVLEKDVKNYEIIEGREIQRLNGKIEGFKVVKGWIKDLEKISE